MLQEEFIHKILHLDLDSFYVSVERLKNKELQGIPLIIGGKNGRGVVASCSYEARKFGVRSAMPTRMALKLCPQATIISGDMETYSRFSNDITEIIAGKAPLFEKSSIDEFYLDLTGMDKFFGCFKWSMELRKKIVRETGLPISFGLSVNKTVSKVATSEFKPNGKGYVAQGSEKGFLAPMPIRKIPMIGEKTFQALQLRGIRKVKTLSQMPIPMLESFLGKNGRVIWEKANGIDKTPVVPYSEAKSISTERTFQQDTIDVVKLRRILISMTEKLTHKLREDRKLTACVTVKIRYSNFDTETRQKHIPYTASDQVLIRHVEELFDKLYTRRMLLRLVGVRFSKLVYGGYQLTLFDEKPEQVRLYEALDRMKRRYGIGAVVRAGTLGLFDKKGHKMAGIFADPLNTVRSS